MSSNGIFYSEEAVSVDALVTPSEGWLTLFKFPQLRYEGPEAVDGIDLCCPDVRLLVVALAVVNALNCDGHVFAF